jgi:hypothetical protein
MNLFPEKHDVGGRSYRKVPPGVACGVTLSFRGRYRPLLLRSWTPPNQTPRTALWIGLNPSVADGVGNDPTIAVECVYTRRWGLDRYVKCNLSDYRATDPKRMIEFIRAGGDPWSKTNLSDIMEQAAEAELIVMAHGVVPKELSGCAAAITADLRAAGYTLWCLGLTKGGWPCHPSRLGYSRERFPYLNVPKTVA